MLLHVINNGSQYCSCLGRNSLQKHSMSQQRNWNEKHTRWIPNTVDTKKKSIDNLRHSLPTPPPPPPHTHTHTHTQLGVQLQRFTDSWLKLGIIHHFYPLTTLYNPDPNPNPKTFHKVGELVRLPQTYFFDQLFDSQLPHWWTQHHSLFDPLFGSHLATLMNAAPFPLTFVFIADAKAARQSSGVMAWHCVPDLLGNRRKTAVERWSKPHG